MPCYPYLCFDADHTLFTFVEAEVTALDTALTEFGVPLTEEQFPLYHRLNMEVWHQYALGQFPQSRIETLRMERFLGALGLSIPPLAFSDSFLNHLALNDQPEPGVLDTLRKLSENHTIAILTNGLSQLQRPRLEHSVLKPYINYHIIAQELGVSKPKPEYYARAMEIIGCTDPNRVLMTGDSLSADIGGALNFGIDACWYNPRGLENSSPNVPTYEIRHMSELLKIV